MSWMDKRSPISNKHRHMPMHITNSFNKFPYFFPDLETSLMALEKLDRASPDLWPDHSKIFDTMMKSHIQYHDNLTTSNKHWDLIPISRFYCNRDPLLSGFRF